MRMTGERSEGGAAARGWALGWLECCPECWEVEATYAMATSGAVGYLPRETCVAIAEEWWC
jgi:hypothetical protein